MTEFMNNTNIDTLIKNLASPYQAIRKRACESLVALGTPAVASLTEALDNPNYHVRWEAAKALGEIGNPAAAPPLVKCLEDHHLDVRWRAAEDLIAFGREGLIPLLQALIEHPESVRLREGSYHVLRTLGNTSLKGVTEPVLRALEEIEPAMKVPQAAHAALHRLTKEQYQPVW
jgi:HEAT repeat protein